MIASILVLKSAMLSSCLFSLWVFCFVVAEFSAVASSIPSTLVFRSLTESSTLLMVDLTSLMERLSAGISVLIVTWRFSILLSKLSVIVCLKEG